MDQLKWTFHLISIPSQVRAKLKLIASQRQTTTRHPPKLKLILTQSLKERLQRLEDSKRRKLLI